MDDIHQCRTCGYFCVSGTLKGDRTPYHEAKDNRRKAGPNPFRGSLRPCCYQGKPIIDEVEEGLSEQQKENGWHSNYESMLTKDRTETCDRWYRWKRGHSPERHEEMESALAERMRVESSAIARQTRDETSQKIAEMVETFTKRFDEIKDQEIRLSKQIHDENSVAADTLEAKQDKRFEESEENINTRFTKNLFYQFLFALLAAVVAMVCSKILPGFLGKAP